MAAAPDGGSSLDAGVGSDAATIDSDAGEPAPVDPCASFARRIVRRKEWLEARRQEQFLRGPADPAHGVPSAVHLWCEAHPSDEDCLLGGTAIEISTDELVWTPDAGIDDFDLHVVGMKRELRRCQERQRQRWR